MTVRVAVVLGSNSDYPRVEKAFEVFKHFRIPYEVRILSAHRTPDAVAEFAKNAATRGIRVIIAAAGGAAHLPGVIASFTILPVVGLPLAIPPLNGLDSLLSMAQMPGGVPVAVMSAGQGGPENAALAAVSILALGDHTLSDMLRSYRNSQANKVLERDSVLQWKMADEEAKRE